MIGRGGKESPPVAERQTASERETKRERQRERKRYKSREPERQRERQSERERERERERCCLSRDRETTSTLTHTLPSHCVKKSPYACPS